MSWALKILYRHALLFRRVFRNATYKWKLLDPMSSAPLSELDPWPIAHWLTRHCGYVRHNIEHALWFYRMWVSSAIHWESSLSSRTAMKLSWGMQWRNDVICLHENGMTNRMREPSLLPAFWQYFHNWGDCVACQLLGLFAIIEYLAHGPLFPVHKWSQLTAPFPVYKPESCEANCSIILFLSSPELSQKDLYMNNTSKTIFSTSRFSNYASLSSFEQLF